MNRTALLLVAISVLCVSAMGANAYEIEKSALFVFLHEVKPIEEDGAKAIKQKNYALALRKYREALRGYQRIWKDYPNLPHERPFGLDHMVDESITDCKKVIEEIKDKGEAEDKFYQKLNQMVRVDFVEMDVRDVAKSLTFLTDVNIIVDETVFDKSNKVLKRKVNIRTDDPLPLKTIITRMCEETGLAYSIESDHVYISTRVKLDEQE
jgi:hypothetical protein